jgi:hypothetical protein
MPWDFIMSDDHVLTKKIEAVLNELLDATGASRGTLRADDPKRGWKSSVPCAEVLRDGAPTMLHDNSLNHRAAPTIQWITETKSILKQENLHQITPSPPRELIETYLAKAQMVGPVLDRDYVFGWVSAHDVKGPRRWSRTDEQAMKKALTAIAAMVL